MVLFVCFFLLLLSCCFFCFCFLFIADGRHSFLSSVIRCVYASILSSIHSYFQPFLFHPFLLPSILTSIHSHFLHSYFHLFSLPPFLPPSILTFPIPASNLSTSIHSYFHPFLQSIPTSIHSYFHSFSLPSIFTSTHSYCHPFSLPNIPTSIHSFFHPFLLPSLPSMSSFSDPSFRRSAATRRLNTGSLQKYIYYFSNELMGYINCHVLPKQTWARAHTHTRAF